MLKSIWYEPEVVTVNLPRDAVLNAGLYAVVVSKVIPLNPETTFN